MLSETLHLSLKTEPFPRVCTDPHSTHYVRFLHNLIDNWLMEISLKSPLSNLTHASVMKDTIHGLFKNRLVVVFDIAHPDRDIWSDVVHRARKI